MAAGSGEQPSGDGGLARRCGVEPSATASAPDSPTVSKDAAGADTAAASVQVGVATMAAVETTAAAVAPAAGFEAFCRSCRRKRRTSSCSARAPSAALVSASTVFLEVRGGAVAACGGGRVEGCAKGAATAAARHAETVEVVSVNGARATGDVLRAGGMAGGRLIVATGVAVVSFGESVGGAAVLAAVAAGVARPAAGVVESGGGMGGGPLGSLPQLSLRLRSRPTATRR